MNYAATAARARATIAKAGMLMTLRVQAAGEFDPATGYEDGAVEADFACVGLLQNPDSRYSGLTYQDGTQIQAGDKAALLAAGGLNATPKPGDELVVKGKAWRIMLVQTLEPGGTPILHRCFLRAD